MATAGNTYAWSGPTAGNPFAEYGMSQLPVTYTAFSEPANTSTGLACYFAGPQTTTNVGCTASSPNLPFSENCTAQVAIDQPQVSVQNAVAGKFDLLGPSYGVPGPGNVGAEYFTVWNALGYNAGTSGMWHQSYVTDPSGFGGGGEWQYFQTLSRTSWEPLPASASGLDNESASYYLANGSMLGSLNDSPGLNNLLVLAAAMAAEEEPEPIPISYDSNFDIYIGYLAPNNVLGQSQQVPIWHATWQASGTADSVLIAPEIVGWTGQDDGTEMNGTGQDYHWPLPTWNAKSVIGVNAGVQDFIGHGINWNSNASTATRLTSAKVSIPRLAHPNGVDMTEQSPESDKPSWTGGPHTFVDNSRDSVAAAVSSGRKLIALGQLAAAYDVIRSAITDRQLTIDQQVVELLSDIDFSTGNFEDAYRLLSNFQHRDHAPSTALRLAVVRAHLGKTQEIDQQKLTSDLRSVLSYGIDVNRQVALLAWATKTSPQTPKQLELLSLLGLGWISETRHESVTSAMYYLRAQSIEAGNEFALLGLVHCLNPTLATNDSDYAMGFLPSEGKIREVIDEACSNLTRITGNLPSLDGRLDEVIANHRTLAIRSHEKLSVYP